MWIVEMRVENLLAVGKGTVQTRPHNLQVLVHLLVRHIVARLQIVHLNLSVELWGIDDGCEAAAACLR
jgi:hypothetical protein